MATPGPPVFPSPRFTSTGRADARPERSARAFLTSGEHRGPARSSVLRGSLQAQRVQPCGASLSLEHRCPSVAVSALPCCDNVPTGLGTQRWLFWHPQQASGCLALLPSWGWSRKECFPGCKTAAALQAAAQAVSGTTEAALSQHGAVSMRCGEVQPSEQNPSARQLGPSLSTRAGAAGAAQRSSRRAEHSAPHPERSPQGNRQMGRGAGSGWFTLLPAERVPVLFTAHHPRAASCSHRSPRGTTVGLDQCRVLCPAASQPRPT